MRPFLFIAILLLALVNDCMSLRGALIRSGRSFRPSAETIRGLAQRRYAQMERFGETPIAGHLLPIDANDQQPLVIFESVN
ncbi:unnamed protein product, partial [Mesorhabditis belari]|uniref:Uncharacterized protein n=1 Tax=Mesorhabditis belari TaxID=2138241 RepID=A0AAF3FPL7_9BILA